MGEICMRKAMVPAITMAILTAVVLLAAYSLGAFDGDGVKHVDSLEFPIGGFSFKGGVKDGELSGEGEIVLNDGNVFQGGFEAGRFSGDGAYYSNADSGEGAWDYVGVFEEGRTSNGRFSFADGSVVSIDCSKADVVVEGPDWQYSGAFGDQGSSGTGSFTFADGSVYTGGFLGSLADGEGEYTDGMERLIYSGRFRNGSFDGQGTYYSHEGWSYSGAFKDGLFDGEGTITDGNLTIQGVWDKGVQVR